MKYLRQKSLKHCATFSSNVKYLEGWKCGSSRHERTEMVCHRQKLISKYFLSGSLPRINIISPSGRFRENIQSRPSSCSQHTQRRWRGRRIFKQIISSAAVDISPIHKPTANLPMCFSLAFFHGEHRWFDYKSWLKRVRINFRCQTPYANLGVEEDREKLHFIDLALANGMTHWW